MYQLAKEEGYSLIEIVYGMFESFKWDLQLEREARFMDEDAYAGEPFSYDDAYDKYSFEPEDDLPF